MPIFQAVIRFPATNLPSYRPFETWTAKRALTLQSQKLARAIEIGFNVRPAHVIAEVELPTTKYDFYIRIPELAASAQQAFFESVFDQAAQAAFGLSVRRENRALDVLVLKTNAVTLETLANSTNANGHNELSGHEICGTDEPILYLCDGLEKALVRPVVDGTGITTRYNYDVKWTVSPDPEQNLREAQGALAKLGLDLVKTNECAEVVVVRKAF
jgi:uncharacterized protein (TIGR03435 family)